MSPSIDIFLHAIVARMASLNSKDVVHRDLRPANLMLDVKICARIKALRMAKFVEVSAVTVARRAVGTPPFRMPEIFTNKPCSHTTDVYPGAMISSELPTRDQPWKGDLVPNGRNPMKRISSLVAERPEQCGQRKLPTSSGFCSKIA
jgi:serine/threonine protein kinase